LDLHLDLRLAGLREVELFGRPARDVDEGLFAAMRSLTVTTTLLPFSTFVTFTLVPKGSLL
jgi:hypothetical protein